MRKLTGKLIKYLMLILVTCIVITAQAIAQKYYTKNGNISFFSKTNIENISSDNNQVMSVLNTQNGELQFSLLIKNFHFKKSLMEEHFNENYLESDKYPKATFKGSIVDMSKVNFATDGSYKVMVAGDLTMHGITQKISTAATVTIKGEKIIATSVFIVKPASYNINIPKVVRNNIAETIEVSVNCNYDQKM